jgi:hypothetical protein
VALVESGVCGVEVFEGEEFGFQGTEETVGFVEGVGGLRGCYDGFGFFVLRCGDGGGGEG